MLAGDWYTADGVTTGENTVVGAGKAARQR
jgi:hypothetical protein